ncbi:hypothetical protein HMPREF3130_10805 [Corynebacterium sp. HMSC14B06]|uniref:hypothetical protein n=1 Tax=Corynebacterium sp. HMSC14B06 TaxID=1581098 RepID=UPI0008A3B7A2|nr:hypothetical protein [Corynebacterium sp. HMSC14B06]OFT68567.1 hypothetical protein HMPREF3130_10805 [Corynebacterium sp. HMSC14B06]
MPTIRTENATPSFFEKLEARREAKYTKRVEQMSSWLPKWRNQAARRKLVIAYEVCVVLMLLSGIALLGSLTDMFPGWLSLLWPVVSLILIFVWTSLNITVDMVDSAPISLLDEYQQEQILNLRGLTYRCYTYFGLTVFLALLIVGVPVMNSQADWGHYVPYSFGVVGIVIFLFISTLPTVVYAWNLRDD